MVSLFRLYFCLSLSPFMLSLVRTCSLFPLIINFLICVVTTGFSPNIQHLVQMLGAAMIPGNPQANMYFTLYGYQTYTLTLNLLRDLKMVCFSQLPNFSPSHCVTGSIHETSSSSHFRIPNNGRYNCSSILLMLQCSIKLSLYFREACSTMPL